MYRQFILFVPDFAEKMVNGERLVHDFPYIAKAYDNVAVNKLWVETSKVRKTLV